MKLNLFFGVELQQYVFNQFSRNISINGQLVILLLSRMCQNCAKNLRNLLNVLRVDALLCEERTEDEIFILAFV